MKTLMKATLAGLMLLPLLYQPAQARDWHDDGRRNVGHYDHDRGLHRGWNNARYHDYYRPAYVPVRRVYYVPQPVYYDPYPSYGTTSFYFRF